MKTSSLASGAVVFAGLALVGAGIAAIVGYIINLATTIKLAVAAGPFTTLLAVKALGIVVPPLGAILGLFF